MVRVWSIHTIWMYPSILSHLFLHLEHCRLIILITISYLPHNTLSPNLPNKWKQTALMNAKL
jgi:hypothetical protein